MWVRSCELVLVTDGADSAYYKSIWNTACCVQQAEWSRGGAWIFIGYYMHQGLSIVEEDLVIDNNPTEALGMFSQFHFPGHLQKHSWWCLAVVGDELYSPDLQ